MRIAVSGTHFMGKTTLIEDFIKVHSEYRYEIEVYYKLQNEKSIELAVEPSLDSLIEQLDYCIELLNQYTTEPNIIFDRCPVDYIAYSMCAIEQDLIDINDTEIAERFQAVKEALDSLNMIIFLPMTKEHTIEYIEENPAYREAADRYFKKIYRDDVLDIFPSYVHPKIIEIWGNRSLRLQKLECYIIK